MGTVLKTCTLEWALYLRRGSPASRGACGRAGREPCPFPAPPRACLTLSTRSRLVQAVRQGTVFPALTHVDITGDRTPAPPKRPPLGSSVGSFNLKCAKAHFTTAGNPTSLRMRRTLFGELQHAAARSASRQIPAPGTAWAPRSTDRLVVTY